MPLATDSSGAVSLRTATKTVSSAYSPDYMDGTLFVNATAAAVVITLKNKARRGQVHRVVKIDIGSNAVTVKNSAGTTLASTALQDGAIEVQYDDKQGRWRVVNKPVAVANITEVTGNSAGSGSDTVDLTTLNAALAEHAGAINGLRAILASHGFAA